MGYLKHLWFSLLGHLNRFRNHYQNSSPFHKSNQDSPTENNNAALLVTTYAAIPAMQQNRTFEFGETNMNSVQNHFQSDKFKQHLEELHSFLGALDNQYPCRQQSIGSNKEVPCVLDAASQTSDDDDDKCGCGSCDPLTCGCGSRLYIASSFLCEICEVQLM